MANLGYLQISSGISGSLTQDSHQMNAPINTIPKINKTMMYGVDHRLDADSADVRVYIKNRMEARERMPPSMSTEGRGPARVDEASAGMTR